MFSIKYVRIYLNQRNGNSYYTNRINKMKKKNITSSNSGENMKGRSAEMQLMKIGINQFVKKIFLDRFPQS